MKTGTAARSKPKSRSFFDATAAFRKGSDTPRAFLERCIATIEAHEDRIHAFVHLNFDAARAASDAATARWKSGRPLCAIDGMPIGVKDIIETADMPTEQGSPLFAGWHGRRDAAAVAALREAGATVLGKTVTTEFAAAQARETRNPWDLKRTPGGSSSGSAAAVAAGMVAAALGTQVVGSTIRPASFCGCFGFKPSVGAINRGGSFDEFSQSCTAVLAPTLDESWSVAREISVRAGGDPGYPGISGPARTPAARKPQRVAMLQTAGWKHASASAKQALQDARSRMVAAGIEVVDRTDDEAVEAVESAIFNAYALTMDINAWEGRWPLNTYARDMQSEGLSRHARDRLAAGNAMNLDKYRSLIAEREQVRKVHAALRDRYDACVTLSATAEAPEGIATTGNPVFAAPASLLGTPALSLPVLWSADLPLGLQLIGFMNDDAALFATAGALLPLFEGDAHA